MVMKMKWLLCMMLMVAALASTAQADTYIVGRWARGPMQTFLEANFSAEQLGTITGNRYNTSRPPATADDLVIFIRTTSSGDYDDGAAEVNGWNDIPAPWLMMAPHTTRKEKMGWATGNTTFALDSAGAETTVFDSTDPIFAGVSVIAGKADLLLDTNTACTSQPTAELSSVGDVLAVGDSGGTSAASIVRIPTGAAWATTDEGGLAGTHPGPRVVFFGSSDDRTNGINSALTADGLTVLANCIQDLLNEKHKPIVDAGTDQAIVTFSTTVTGTASDPDPNEVLSYLWTSSDPGVTIGDDEDPNTTVTFPDFGLFTLTLKATNLAGLERKDSLSVFVIDPGDASAPDPADGATDVVTAPTLSWTAGLDSVSSDVWFGKTAEAMELVSDDQTETTYAPDTLIKGQTYYWAVDETDSGAVIHDGTVWSFTVEGGGGTSNWIGGVDPNNPTDDLWSIEANWDNGVPGLGTAANIYVNGPALIDSTVEAVATGNWTRMGIAAALTDPNLVPTVLNMTGGSLTVKGWALGNKGPAIINMSGGTITTNANLNWGDTYDASDREYGKATLNMSGGTINIGGQLSLFDRNDNCSMTLTGDSVINMANIRLWSADGRTQKIDLAGGKMVLAGDQTAECLDMVNHPVMTGFIAFGGTGSVMVSYDEVADETTVAGCAYNLTADASGDCAVNGDDLELMVANWLYTTPSEAQWSFDMATDPVGTGEWDLVVRGDDPGNANYIMGDDTGSGTLEVTGAGTLLLDQQYAGTVGLFDTDVHLVIKSTNEYAVDFWVNMATSQTTGQAAVGFSTMLDSVVDPIDPNIVTTSQTVEFWTDSIARQQNGYDPFIETGLDPNNYLIIDVNYDYDTDIYAYTIDDGTNPVRSGTYAYVGTGSGTGGFYTIKSGTYGGGAGNDAPGAALIDQFDVHILGSALVIKPGDADRDGDVDLLDFAALAEEWLLDGTL